MRSLSPGHAVDDHCHLRILWPGKMLFIPVIAELSRPCTYTIIMCPSWESLACEARICEGVALQDPGGGAFQ
jgi:hypothetical protein